MPRDLWQKARDRDVARRQRREPKDYDTIPSRKRSRPKKATSIEPVPPAGRRDPHSAGPTYLMPFGKHKGKAFIDIPGSYLKWVLSLKDLYPNTRRAILHVLTLPETAPGRPSPPW